MASGRTGYPALNFGSFNGTASFDWAFVYQYSATPPTISIGTPANWSDQCSFIVDSISTPNVAYSMRRLRAGYTGPLVRIRRSSDNTEQDIGANSGCVLDTAALSAFVGSNSGFVAKWYDQSGNGYDGLQADTGKQLRLVNSGTIEAINGRPAARATNFVAYVAATSGPGIVGSGGMSANIIARSDVVDSGGCVNASGSYLADRLPLNVSLENPLFSLKAIGGQWSLQVREDSNGASPTCVSASASIPASVAQTIYYERARGTAFNLYVNNGLQGTLADTFGDISPQPPSVGSHNNGNSAGGSTDHSIGEYLLWSAPLTGGNRGTLSTDQTSYYGL